MGTRPKATWLLCSALSWTIACQTQREVPQKLRLSLTPPDPADVSLAHYALKTKPAAPKTVEEGDPSYDAFMVRDKNEPKVSAHPLVKTPLSPKATAAAAASGKVDDKTESKSGAKAAKMAEPSVAKVAEPSVAKVAEPSVAKVAEPSVAKVAEPSVAKVAEPSPLAKGTASTGHANDWKPFPVSKPKDVKPDPKAPEMNPP